MLVLEFKIQNFNFILILCDINQMFPRWSKMPQRKAIYAWYKNASPEYMSSKPQKAEMRDTNAKPKAA